ncbi:MAG: response regulator transcription factor [Firmicutes bacterium]|nr:response regulator transcription factor [Candidatus Fermentithermobacillaceae bacterium]
MLRVLLVGGGAVWRLGVKSLLEKTGEATVSLSEEEGTVEGKFDVVVFDAASSGDRWVEKALEIQRKYSGAALVAVLSRSTRDDLILALETGVRGFVQPGTDDGILIDVVRCVAQGNAFVSRAFLGGTEAVALPKGQHYPGLEQKLAQRLTEREKEILDLLTRGLANKEIAQALFITEKTVKNHLYRMFKKLGVQGRTQAAVFAMSLGSHKNKSLD